jgi:hypothetical protein
MRNAICLTLVVVGVCSVQAQAPQIEKPTCLVDIYNQFMDRFSDGNPAWKTEIVLGADVGKPLAPPYKLHYDEGLGYYSYRLKRWDELNDYEKFALQNDPRLPHFIREEAWNIRKTNPRQPGQTTIGGTAGTQASTATDGPQPSSVANNSPTETPIGGPAKQRGILIREGASALAYKFEPDELINLQPLRLMEAPER